MPAEVTASASIPGSPFDRAGLSHQRHSGTPAPRLFGPRSHFPISDLEYGAGDLDLTRGRCGRRERRPCPARPVAAELVLLLGPRIAIRSGDLFDRRPLAVV
jgi:hypothetical protein